MHPPKSGAGWVNFIVQTYSDPFDVANLAPSPYVIDNLDAKFSRVGAWTLARSTPGYYGTDYLFTAAGSGTRTATWAFSPVAPGFYTLSEQWTAAANRATNATYTVTNNGASVGTAVANQRLNGGVFVPLGVFPVTADGTLAVTLSDAANGFVVADAARLALNVYSPTVDNGGAGYTTVGTWTNSTSSAGYTGANYAYAPAGAGTHTATWTLTVPAAGNYDVQVIWISNASRATNAPYTILNNGNPIGPVVTKNQKVGGGVFQTLGTYALTPGTLQIRLSNNANGFVTADAARLKMTP